MNTEGQLFFGTREFRISMIAIAAVALLALAAFLFGTGLRADTSASVAPSPLGSSLTAVRERTSEDFVERLRNSAEAAKWASVAARDRELADFYLAVNATNAKAAASRFEDRYDRMNSSPAATSVGLSAADYAAMHSIPAASVPNTRAALEERWAPFYAGLDKALKDAGARP